MYQVLVYMFSYVTIEFTVQRHRGGRSYDTPRCAPCLCLRTEHRSPNAHPCVFERLLYDYAELGCSCGVACAPFTNYYYYYVVVGALKGTACAKGPFPVTSTKVSVESSIPYNHYLSILSVASAYFCNHLHLGQVLGRDCTPGRSVHQFKYAAAASTSHIQTQQRHSTPRRAHTRRDQPAHRSAAPVAHRETNAALFTKEGNTCRRVEHRFLVA